MRHLAATDRNPAKHSQPVERVNIDDGVIAVLPGKNIAEPLAQPPHGFVGGKARQRPRSAIAHRPQIIDPVAMIGMIMGPEHRIDPVDIIGEQLVA